MIRTILARKADLRIVAEVSGNEARMARRFLRGRPAAIKPGGAHKGCCEADDFLVLMANVEVTKVEEHPGGKLQSSVACRHGTDRIS